MIAFTLAQRPPGIGHTYQCGSSLYYSDGSMKLRPYSMPVYEIAASWDIYWNKPVTGSVLCRLPKGPALGLNPFFKIGESILCTHSEPKHRNAWYRFSEDYRLRLYPSSKIAASWNKNWNKGPSIDCSGMLFGPDMAAK